MELRYDDDFIESAVFAVAGARRQGVPSLQVRRFHAARERCYDILDPDERNAAFFRLHLEWFREWGLEKVLLDLVDEYPLVSPALNILAFRKVRLKKDEGAELYVHPEQGRSAVVAMRPERFEHDDAVSGLLRHEFMHLSDMVDPAFGYSPSLNVRGTNPTQQRIIRERYRLLWDITIDGRLTRSTAHDRTQAHFLRTRHRALFDRAFSFWAEDQRSSVFELLWEEVRPSHERLLALAADPRDLSHATAPLPGSPCPLCQFPTFDWRDVTDLSREVTSKLIAQFPDWRPEQGACKRCIEIYELAGKFELPSTVVL